MLFPIKMALSILGEWFSVISSTVAARLLPSSARERILILLTVVRAVSAEEKKADNNNRINNMKNCMASLGSNDIFNSFYFKLDEYTS